MGINFVIFFFLFLKSYQKSDVYFTKEISPSKVVEMFKKLNVELKGNVALKVHSGEPGGKYFLTPDFLQPIYDETNGTFVETNAAYKEIEDGFDGKRYTTELHKELLKDHHWVDNNRRFVIMDDKSENDFNLTVNNPVMIKENIVGGHLKDFESCIILSHVKGHPMGGFGGALKQLSIGFASQVGKTWIHTAGNETEWQKMDDHLASQENFTASMGDAASTIVEYFRKKGGIVFINVIVNVSLECDCGGGLSPAPKIHDIGILASTDPVAIDRASVDLIKNTKDEGTGEWIEQLNKLKGENTITVAEQHGIGSQQYNLIDIDNPDTKNEESSNLWIILIALGVILGVGILLLVIFCLKKTNNDNNNINSEGLINNNDKIDD